MVNSETSEVRQSAQGVCGGVVLCGTNGVCGKIEKRGGPSVTQLYDGIPECEKAGGGAGENGQQEDLICPASRREPTPTRSEVVMQKDGANSLKLRAFDEQRDKLDKENIYDMKKSVRGSLPPRTAVNNREAELNRIRLKKLYALGQVSCLGECRQLEEQKGKVAGEAGVEESISRCFSLMRGPGKLMIPDSVKADQTSLVDRVRLGLPEMGGVSVKGGTTCVSSQWFCGKMSERWFEKMLMEVDHDDDRVRRDWSLKASERKKGKNRYAGRWAAWMAKVEYQGKEEYPYSPACRFGKNVSSNKEIELQRQKALVYCELLRSYVEWWTRRESRHPVALVGFSGAGLMVRGFLWMGVRCIMIDIDDQIAAPIGEDCVMIQHDVLKMELGKMEVDLIQMSPPCPPSSTAPHLGGVPAKAKQLIPEVRVMLAEMQAKRASEGKSEVVCSMENVNSSGDVLEADMKMDGQMVGSRVNRARLFETNFGVKCSLQHSIKLCQGSRRKIPKSDRKLCEKREYIGVNGEVCTQEWHLVPPCCDGSSWSPVGTTAGHTGSRSRWCKAMGLEPDVPTKAIADGLHVLQGALIAGLSMMEICVRAGLPEVTMDMVMDDPSWIDRIRRWDLVDLSNDGDPEVSTRACEGVMPDTLAEFEWGSMGEFQRHVMKEVGYSNLRDMCEIETCEAFVADLVVDDRHVFLEDIESSVLSTCEWAVRQVEAGGRVTALVRGADVSNPKWVSYGWSRVKRWRSGEVRIGCLDDRDEGRAADVEYQLWQLKPVYQGFEDIVSEELSLELDPRQGDAKVKRVPRHVPIVLNFERMLELGVPGPVVDIVREGSEAGEGVQTMDAGLMKPSIADQYKLEPMAELACVDEMNRMIDRQVLSKAVDCPDIIVSDVHPWVLVWQHNKWRGAVDCKSLNVRTDNLKMELPTHQDMEKTVESGMTSFASRDMSDGFFHVRIGRRCRGKFAVRHPLTKEVYLFNALPFGWVLSPFWFTRFSEEIGKVMQVAARRAVDEECMKNGWNRRVKMKMLTYVDDYLLAVTHTHHRELCEIACGAMDRVAIEMGVDLAPHKSVGPVEVIEWLGLLLDARADRAPCLRLPEKKRKNYLSELGKFEKIYREKAKAPARELAGIMGRLNFACKAVHGGMNFMARMWDRFRGVLIDWGRGAVRVANGVRDLKLDCEFWLDLEWWIKCLQSPMSVLLRGDDACVWEVRCGTDGSDWGSGQFIVLDGEEERMQCEWTPTERRKPINWRELNGVLRMLRKWGPRLRGAKLWMAVDNMTTFELLRRFRVSAPEMAELLRRIHLLCVRYEICLVVKHVPGVDLEVPDDMSREAALVEPKQRMTKEAYEWAVRLTGEHTQFLGKEREHCERKEVSRREKEVRSGARESIRWFNPDYRQVAKVLNHVRDELEADPVGFKAAIVIPYRPECVWWALRKHMAVLHTWPRWGQCVEEWRDGRWRSIKSKYPLVLLFVPASAGAGVFQRKAASPLWFSPVDRTGAVQRMTELMSRVKVEMDINSPVSLRRSISDANNQGERQAVRNRVTRSKSGAVRMLAQVKEELSEEVKDLLPSPRQIDGESMEVRTKGGKIKDGGDVIPGDLVWGSYEEPERSGVHGWIGRIRSVSEDRQTGEYEWLRLCEGLGRKYVTFELKGKLRDIDFSDELYRITELVRCFNCKETVTECRLPPMRGACCRASSKKRVSVEKTVLTEFMCRICPEHMELSNNVEIGKKDAGMCVICKSSLANKVVRKHSSQQVLVHDCCMHSESYDMGEAEGALRMAEVESQVEHAEMKKEMRPAREAGAVITGEVETDTAMSRKQVKEQEKFGELAMARFRRCVEGCCARPEPQEMSCRCGVGLHVKCAGVSRGAAALGVFECGDCRLDGMFGNSLEDYQRERAERYAWEQAKGDLSSYAHGTYKGQEAVMKHIAQWHAATGIISDPLQNVEALAMFLRWDTADRDGGRSKGVENTARTLGALMTAKAHPNISKATGITKLLKELKRRFGDAKERDTALPVEYLVTCLDYILDVKKGDVTGRRMALRDAVTLMIEYMAGFRIGEVTEGGGQSHGIDANDIRIYETAVELTLRDRKTCAHPITVTVARHTAENNFDLGGVLLEYYREWGIPTVKTGEKTERHTHAVYYVCRLPLAEYSKDDFEAGSKDGTEMSKFEQALRSMQNAEVSACAKELTARARARVDASNPDYQFINVYGGSKLVVEAAVTQMIAAGFEGAVVDQGPLMRPTKGRYCLHQPISSGNMSGRVKKSMEYAHSVHNAVLDVLPGMKPKWNTHSARRGGAMRALETMNLSGVSKTKIEFHFGWDEMTNARENPMMWMYAGAEERSKRCRVTAFF